MYVHEEGCFGLPLHSAATGLSQAPSRPGPVQRDTGGSLGSLLQRDRGKAHFPRLSMPPSFEQGRYPFAVPAPSQERAFPAPCPRRGCEGRTLRLFVLLCFVPSLSVLWFACFLAPRLSSSGNEFFCIDLPHYVFCILIPGLHRVSRRIFNHLTTEFYPEQWKTFFCNFNS